jgi:hypothetical protein
MGKNIDDREEDEMFRGRQLEDPRPDDAVALIEETSAFLQGRAPDLYEVRGQRIPTWARLNPMAHAPAAYIRALADRHHVEFQPSGSWNWALGSLAEEMVTLAGDEDAELAALQRRHLVPLELLLAADRRLLSAEYVLEIARTLLRSHPSSSTPRPD